MTQEELNRVIEIIKNNMITIYDRPSGSNPRWVLTSMGLPQVKQQIYEELVEAKK